jgi:hypothetical protein
MVLAHGIGCSLAAVQHGAEFATPEQRAPIAADLAEATRGGAHQKPSR